ncbi:hypothetical protein J1N35_013796 [Gossypium stocksii]|uniref:Uncharacterized protein n=1 Tax=Gossypium stocksii TaxID=47602 RepID=A0A9D4A873_9ROSI|nr:hypothetical protein J1N35_013796 [Gossypium stocksii]
MTFSEVYLKGYNAALKKEIPVLSLSPSHFKLVANDKAIGNGLEMLDGNKTHRSQNSLPVSGSGTSLGVKGGYYEKRGPFFLYWFSPLNFFFSFFSSSSCPSSLTSNCFTQITNYIKGIRAIMILMASGGVTMRLQKDMGVMQKDMGLMQQEITQLQTNVTQMDARMESCFKKFHETVKVGIRTELQNFFEQHVGRTTPTTQGQTSNKGKGVLEGR